MSAENPSVEQLSINTIRTLAMDAVQAAKSGHPGTPMALAPVAYTLWNKVLRYDPSEPRWPARDRFILSCGHASMLLYATLHLAGVKQVDANGNLLDEPAIPLDDIRRFRQLHSRCAGHPEHGEAAGIETTTGPLGQGIGNSVGMAIAQRWLAARYHRPGFDLFDYDIYALCSDGDLMEGVGAEAASLAGHLRLANLCWIYDDNGITIEGHTALAFSEDVGRRFQGYGWNVLHVADANDTAALGEAFRTFRQTKSGPTLIVVKSHIAWGAPHKQDTHEAHGSPLGDEEIRLTKKVYGWPEEAKFLVPEEVLKDFAAGIGTRGPKLRKVSEAKFREYAEKYPELGQELELMLRRDLPASWDASIPVFEADAKGMATRISSGKVLNALAKHIPWLIGGAADLAPSTMTRLTMDGAGDLEADSYGGRNMHFGIREHGMAAALNGMALSYLRPYGSTFFVFTDYLRPSLRLSSIMKLPAIYIFTHDSLGVGEDGPTHQPIEHLAALRAIPGLITLRPGDANEVAEAYRAILPLKNRPVALVLTRQNLPTLDRHKFAPATGVARGAYLLADASGNKPDVILMATGSELSLIAAAYEQLTAEGIKVRAVSMPSWELFEDQDQAYRDSVLPPEVMARVAVETGIVQGWHKYLGPKGRFIGMTGFGASAPAELLMKHFGFTVDHVVAEAKAAIRTKLGESS